MNRYVHKNVYNLKNRWVFNKLVKLNKCTKVLVHYITTKQ